VVLLGGLQVGINCLLYLLNFGLVATVTMLPFVPAACWATTDDYTPSRELGESSERSSSVLAPTLHATEATVDTVGNIDVILRRRRRSVKTRGSNEYMVGESIYREAPASQPKEQDGNVSTDGRMLLYLWLMMTRHELEELGAYREQVEMTRITCSSAWRLIERVGWGARRVLGCIAIGYVRAILPP
jgi:hypothetical protein